MRACRWRPWAGILLTGYLAALLPVTGGSKTAVHAQDYEKLLPRIAPLEPDESLATFLVPGGFQLEQVATEPLVADPVALSFDARGRMYVVCMRGYSEQAAENLGQVRLLEDSDADGTYDSSKVFAAGLSWPTGIACYGGGAFVAVAPDLLFLRDTDADGVADERRVVLTGFRRSNVQGLVNSLCWGLDHRLHGATSSSGAELLVPDQGGEPLTLRGRDFAFDPRSSQVMATSGGGQHGMTFDDWGRKLVCSNSRHIEMVMVEDRYLRRNPDVAVPRTRQLIAAEGGQAEIYRFSPVEPWRVVRTRLRVAGQVPGPVESGGRAAGYFTSATGITVYRGDAWPQEHRGEVFIGDVGSNVVHRKKLFDEGIALRAVRADPASEFLSSHEIWFRPVQFANGPDGALYVIDMYREVIEHPLSLPPVIKKHLDLTSGRDRGRIYRLVPNGFLRQRSVRLDEASTRELVETLAHDNGWHRDTAARLLYERQDREAVPLLESLAADSDRPLGRLHALYVLDGLGGLTPSTLTRALADAHPRVREHAVKLAEGAAAKSSGDAALRDALLGLADDPDPRVRWQLALTLGELDDGDDKARTDARTDALARIAARDPGIEWVRVAVLSSLSQGAAEVFAKLAARSELRRDQGGVRLLAELSRLIGAQGRAPATARWVDVLVALPPEERLGTTSRLLEEFSAGSRQSGSSLRELLVSSNPAAAMLIDGILAAARAEAERAAGAGDARGVHAVRALRLSTLERERDTLARALGTSAPKELQLEALGTMSRYRHPEVVDCILEAWPGLTPALRDRALQVVLERSDRADRLLDAVASGGFESRELPPARARFLRTHPETAIRERAIRLLPEEPASDRQEVVARYQQSLQLAGDRERGRTVFREVCAPCHALEGHGHELAPSLGAARERGVETLLVHTLDPNREVHPQYVEYEAVTRDGRVVTGLIAAETANGVTLRGAGGVSETVARGDIGRLRSTGRSLMPEGLEEQIDPAAMADLLAYVLTAGQGTRTGSAARGWKVGVSKRNITPVGSMWMSGYASRNRPSEGKLSDLWAKAMFVEDPAGHRAVLVTLDLIGIGREASMAVRERLKREHRLALADIALCTSHTHTGPVVGRNLMAMYFLDEEQTEKVKKYASRLESLISEVVGEARSNLAPATLAWGTGTCDIAVNRRENKEADVPRLRAQGQLKGPVDHDVPVLKVTTRKGRLLAVAFGYACHCTVLSSYEWSGDYAGFAQMELEKSHPSALALFWAGCGGDQNPLPRRKVALARQYGRRLAASVDQVLRTELQPITGALKTIYSEIDLPFAPLPTRQDLEEQAKSSNRYIASRARLLIDKLERDGALDPTYPYPIQTWHLGPRLRFAILGGEVVVDYSLRLKQELGGDLWVAAYSNDVMCYIPSRRVLAEGGYEGARSMIYYGRPTVWAPELEEMIVEEVKRQARRGR